MLRYTSESTEEKRHSGSKSAGMADLSFANEGVSLVAIKKIIVGIFMSPI